MDEKPDLRFKRGLLDENPSYHFWKAIEHAKSNEWDEALNHAERVKENLSFLAAKYWTSPKPLPITRRQFSALVLSLLLKMDCKPCFFDLVNKVYKEVELSISIAKNIHKEQKLKEWVDEMLDSDAYKSSALGIILNLPKEEQKLFLDKVRKIAKNEVEKPQYIALDILRNFIDEEDVKKIFTALVDDWDKEVRIKCVEALMPLAKEPSVRRALERAYDSERDKNIQSLIKLALEEEKQ